MRYLCILIAVGFVALGAFVGSFLPLGSGSAVLIGGFLGVVLGCLYIDAARKHNWRPLLRSSAHDQQSSNINQKTLKQGMLGAQRAHIIDEVKRQDIWKR
jgi:1,4-dihydroxy-2-naphthoate octaprenyltransferase